MNRSAIPTVLSGAPFTTASARSAGVTDDVLRGQRFRRLFRGVYVLAEMEVEFVTWVRAALLVLPKDAVVSHVSALRLYGFDVGNRWPLHFSTRTSTHTRQRGITTHRRLGNLTPHHVRGLPVTSPDRTLIDIATKVRFVELVQAIEWMIHAKLTSLDMVASRAESWHLDGVRRVRRVLAWVREGAESPMETVLRLMIVFARLPEPLCNVDIRDSSGRFLARGDLVYVQFLVVVEYDGWQHERDGRQRQRDLVRREALEASGWRVIVVTSEDLKSKTTVVRRVHDALIARGYDGRPPQFNAMWQSWFGRPQDVGRYSASSTSQSPESAQILGVS